jgi:phosphoribosylpyrophosphate synthetase
VPVSLTLSLCVLVGAGCTGVDHVITMDLHASQMQGFFGVPVDNLLAEPAIARYLRLHVPDHANSVVVAKNPGATKRSATPTPLTRTQTAPTAAHTDHPKPYTCTHREGEREAHTPHP